MLVLERERIIIKQLCASACSLWKFGEAVDSPLLLTKIVRIRCKTLIVFNGRDLLLSKTCFFFSKVNKKNLAPSSLWDLWVKKYHTLILPRIWLKTKITQIHALAKTRNHCFDQYILYHQHSYTNSALLQRRILVLGKHAGSKNDERLVWKQLCARNKVFNRLEALHRKPSLITRNKIKKYICALTFYQASWLTYRERWFRGVTCARLASYPVGAAILFFTSCCREWHELLITIMSSQHHYELL